MLHHLGQQIHNLSGIAEEHLALTILNILLNIERYLLRNAKVLHIFRNLQTHFLGQLEVIVDGMPGSEHDGSIVQNTNLL